MLKITNHSDETLTLYWFDRSGKPVSYGTLAPGQSRMQDSISTHAWEAKSDDGKLAFRFLSSATGEIEIAANYQPTFIDRAEKVMLTPSGAWSTAQGYGLIDVAKSLGIADTVDLPMNGQTNYVALDAINAPSAWAAGFTGKGVKVAVVDIGIAASPELAGKIVGGYDFQDQDKDPAPAVGPYQDHALGVASIIAASHDPHAGRDTMGVAPDAQLLNVRVGSGQAGSSSPNMAAGIRYAVDNGAKVICMPLQSQEQQVDQAVADAVHYAYQHDVVTVLIGGNFSSFEPLGPALIARLNSEAIVAGNFDVMTGALFASSNQPGATPFPWVVASSSGWVPNPQGGYTYWHDGGTSFAGPYVAGLAALLWQQNPNATAAQIIAKITAGASLGGSPALAAARPSGTMGSAAADIIKALPGSTVDGGAGIDTLVFAGQRSDYTILTAGPAGFSVMSNADRSTVSAVNVERVGFADATIALDVDGGHGGEVYRLYQAAFKRIPDKGGLGYWIGAMDGGLSLQSIADGFVHSHEFRNLYGANPTNTDLVNAMYRNVFGREADAPGLKYWLDELGKGLTTTAMLTAFSDSAENKAALAQVIGQGFDYLPYS